MITKYLKRFLVGVLISTSTLYAVDGVTNLSSSSHTAGVKSNNSDLRFTWSAPSGVDHYYVKLDTNSSANGDIVDNANKITAQTDKTLTVSSSGDYYFHIMSCNAGDDNCTLVNSPSAYNIDLDKGTVTTTTGGSFTGTKSVTLTGSETGTLYYTVNGDDVNSSSPFFVTDNGANPTVTLTLAVTATVKTFLKDSAGNIGDTVDTTYTLTNNPSLKTSTDGNISGETIATNNANGATTVSSLKVLGDGFIKYKYKLPAASSFTQVDDISTLIDISNLSTEGVNTISILGGDAYNFQPDSAATTISFIIDNTAPSGQNVSVNGVDYDENNNTTKTFNDNFTFVLSAVDANKTYYTLDGTTPSNTSTLYSGGVTTTASVNVGATQNIILKFVSYDETGNKSAVKTVTYIIDKEKPTAVLPDTHTFSDNSFVETLSTTDSEAAIYYKISDNNITGTRDNTFTKYESAITIGQGKSVSQYLGVIVVDIAGNESDIQTVKFTYNTVAVTMSLTGITEGQTIATNSDAGAIPTKRITVNGDNFTYFKYKLDDSNVTGSSSNTFSSIKYFDLDSNLTDGNHTIYVGVDTNQTGDYNLSESNITFTVDNTAPSVPVINDTNFSTSSYSVTLTKPTDADYLMYSTDGYTFTTVSATTSVTIDTNTTFTLKSKDEVGNISATKSATFIYKLITRTISAVSSVDFSNVNRSATKDMNITLSSSGTTSTTIGTISLENNNDFNITSNTCSSQTINSGSTCIITISLTPTTLGSITDTLTIPFNGTATQELNISLSGTGTNNMPIITTLDDINTSEDTNISGVFTATDVDGNNSTLRFFVDTNGTKGLLTLDTNGSYVYVPTLNLNGEDTVRIKVLDDLNASYEHNITVNITPVNDLPYIEVNGNVANIISIDANSTFTISYDANDSIDNEDVNISSIDYSNADGNVSWNDSNITFTPDGNISKGGGKYFIITFSDGSGIDVNKTVNISWANAIPALTIATNVSSLTMSEDGNSSGNMIVVSDTDSDDNITITITTNATHGTVVLSDYNLTGIENNTTYTYTPIGNYNGSDSFILKFDDGFGGIIYQTINITVNNTNDAPTWNSSVPTKTTEEDKDLNVSLDAIDIDPNDTITYTATGSDANSTVILSITGSTLTISPVENQNGDLNITVTATDTNGSNITQTFDLNITAVDDAPVINHIIPYRFEVNASNKSFDINVSDVDDDNITFDINSSDTNIVDVNVTGSGATNAIATITLLPDDNATGTVTITLIAITSDLNVTKTFTVTIKDTNVSFDRNATSSYDGNKTTTSFSGLDNGKSLEVVENDDGKVSATLDGNKAIKLLIDVVGADISVDVNGSLTTSITDGNITKEVVVKSDGTISTKLDTNSTTNNAVSSFVDGDINTTITSDGSIETKITVDANTKVEIKLDTDGTATSSIEVAGGKTEITTSTVDTNTTVESNGDIKTVFTLAKEVQLDISADDGVITPTISGGAPLPSSLPVGTKVTVDNNSTIKFEFVLPSTLTF